MIENIKIQHQEQRQRDPLDALREWYHLVPEGLRRIEYEYYKFFRTQKMMRRFKNKNEERHGRFALHPEYTPEQEKEDWDNFRESFLRAPAKKERLLEIVKACEKDLPKLKAQIEEDLKNLVSIKSLRQPQAFILGGSVVIGPRDIEKDTTSDIDIYVIMKDECFTRNLPNDWQITNLCQGDTETRYQIIFVGESNKNIPSFNPVHILAQPHIVIESLYDLNDLQVLKKKVIQDSLESMPGLIAGLEVLKVKMDKQKQKDVIE